MKTEKQLLIKIKSLARDCNILYYDSKRNKEYQPLVNMLQSRLSQLRLLYWASGIDFKEFINGELKEIID